MAISERDHTVSERESQSTEPSNGKQKKKKAPKIAPNFSALEGLSPVDPLYQHRKAYIYEQFLGDKTAEMFRKHGEPQPEEWSAVHRTLRAVFGGEFSREMARWEKSRVNRSISPTSKSGQ